MSLICHTPIVIQGYPCALWPFSTIWQWETLEKTGVGMSDWWLLEQLLAWRWHPVASSEALDLLHWAMGVLLHRRIGMAIKTARKVGIFIHHCVVECCPDVRGSNMEQVVAQWRYPPLGDSAWIASVPPHGHRNGLQWRCIWLLPPTFLLSGIVAKDHVMVH